MRKLVEEDLRLPYLKITTDYSPSDSARITARVEALLEMVRAKSAEGVSLAWGRVQRIFADDLWRQGWVSEAKLSAQWLWPRRAGLAKFALPRYVLHRLRRTGHAAPDGA